MKRFLLLTTTLISYSHVFALGDITIKNNGTVGHVYKLTPSQCYHGSSDESCAGDSECKPIQTGCIQPGDVATINNLRAAGNFPVRPLLKDTVCQKWPPRDTCKLTQCEYERSSNPPEECKPDPSWCLQTNYPDQGAQIRIDVYDCQKTSNVYGGQFQYNPNVAERNLQCNGKQDGCTL